MYPENKTHELGDLKIDCRKRNKDGYKNFYNPLLIMNPFIRQNI